MEIIENTSDNSLAPLPERPDFLKVLCIISFVWCGIMILVFSLGLISLFLGEEMINTMWEKILESQPKLESIDRFEFFHEFGMTCVYNLIGNIVSLIGVIFMWRLNKIGFFIYAIAELAVNFFGVDVNTAEQSSSHAGLIFMFVIDTVFIVLYALNLKHMGKKAGQDSQFA